MSDSGTTRTGDVGLFALAAGTSIGRYQIVSVLGQGGFGITYRARDTRLNRDVAIKEYLPSALAVRQGGVTVLPRSTEVADDFTWGRDRFVAEGSTLASLHDAPAIVRVFDFLESNGTAYIVMELVPGETLEARIRRQKTLKAGEIEAILWPLLDGLTQVHATGFLHRDIKPANILLRSDGRPTLIDFGASRAAMAGRSTAMTAIFTPGFAAVEQMASARQGPWTDIYGLSATLYTAIAGGPPPAAIDRVLDDSYRPLAELKPAGFPHRLLAGIDAGLAVRAQDRPQDIASWRALLAGDDAAHAATVAIRPTPAPAPPASGPSTQEILERTEQPSVAPAPAAPSTAQASKRRPVAVYAGLGVLALLLLGGGYYALQDKPKPQTVVLNDMKVEDLEKALEARRKADADAADKRRLEEEAQKKAAADAEAKRTADAELEKIRQERQELERLRAQLEEQKKAADGQRQAQIEEEQRKADAAAAEKRRAEEEAQKKADAEAKQKAEADAALARAQQERARADAEAKAKAEAEARQKADADAKVRAEAEAREKAAAEKAKQEAEAKAKAEADDKKAAEAAENGLRLQQPDRQRLQIALTSLGFDTRGSDGAFGPRSREMITAWQKARNQPATGFLNANQQQQLQREAAAALQKYDDDQKKIEEEKKKAEDEAKARAAAGGNDGDYGGSFVTTNILPTYVNLKVAGSAITGEASSAGCGSYPFKLAIAASGQVSGAMNTRNGLGGCITRDYSVSGRFLPDGTLQLDLGERLGNAQATLRKGVAVSAPSVAPGAAGLDGTYGGSITLSKAGGLMTVTGVTLRLSGGAASGTMNNPRCGDVPLSVRVSPAGQVSSTINAADGSPQCQLVPYTVDGKIEGEVMSLTMRAPGSSATGSLRKGAGAAVGSAQPGSPPPPAAPSNEGATYGGTVSLAAVSRNAAPVMSSLNVRLADGKLVGQLVDRVCGALPVSLTVSPTGQINGTMQVTEGTYGCSPLNASVSGTLSDAEARLNINSPMMRGSVVLKKGAVAATPGASAPASEPARALQFRGALGMALTMGSSGTMGVTADLRLAGGRLTGQVSERRCGNYTLDVAVSPSGEISGDMKFVEDPQCVGATARVSGRVSGDSLQISIKGMKLTVDGTLKAVP